MPTVEENASATDPGESPKGKPMAEEIGFYKDRIRELEGQAREYKSALDKRDSESKKYKVRLKETQDALAECEAEVDRLHALEKEWGESAESIQAVIDQNDAYEKQVAELEARVEELDGQIDTLTEGYLNPDDKDELISQLESQILSMRHEAAFAEALAHFTDGEGVERKLAPKATISKLMQEIGYEHEGEDPDPAKIIEKLNEAVETVPYLLVAGEASPAGAPGGGKGAPEGARRVPVGTNGAPVGAGSRGESRPPGPGVQRGNANNNGNMFVVTPAELRNPRFMEANEEAIRVAQRQGRFRIEQR